MRKNSLLTLSAVLSTTVLLSACGGGDSGGSSSNGSGSSSTNVNHVTPTSSKLLAQDTIIPATPVNDNPVKIYKDSATIEALKNGVYKTGLTRIFINLSGQKDDCSMESGIYCPYFIRYRLDTRTNKIVQDSWAYMPIQKRWLQLDNSVTEHLVYSPFRGDIISDGNKWYRDRVKIAGSKVKVLKDKLIYPVGFSELALSGKETNIANKNYQSNLSNNPAVYSTKARSYDFSLILEKGEILSLDDTGTWASNSSRSTDDNNKYKSLADYRDAHTNKESAVCFIGKGTSYALVFEPTKLGAVEYKGRSTCSKDNLMQSEAGKLPEGIKTIAGKKVIYLGQGNTQSSLNESTSKDQYLWVITLGNDGLAYQGKAYQQGYAMNYESNYVNKVAVQDWLKTKYNEKQALTLPN